MGFCYQGRKLCCDVCGKAGARKVKCPSGYCQAVAMCPECRKSPEVKVKMAGYHKNCAARHAEYMAREAARAKLLEEGKFLRCSAMGCDDGSVHVIFRGKDSELGFKMASATYDAFPLGSDVTPEDFAKVGTLTPAATNYYNASGLRN